jgi:hypothetical protein
MKDILDSALGMIIKPLSPSLAVLFFNGSTQA